MTIAYTLDENLYLNITNRCSCNCVFCVRNKKDHVGSADNLWLEREPTVEEVVEELKRWNLSDFGEIVFCGYGEPTERLSDLLEIAKYLKSVTDRPIRINTNGLSDLRYQRDTAQMLEGLIDSVSVSMNAGDAEKYFKITRNEFGISSFDAMLRFARNCKQFVKHVRLSIVDILDPDEIEKCKKISREIEVPLLIRKYDT
jgi:radical SAM enzyme (TIGR04100 family)